MRRPASVLFGLLLAAPLMAVPGSGFDTFRLPAVLAIVSCLLGAAFLRSSRGGDRPRGPAPLRTAGGLLLGATLLSLAGAGCRSDGVVPVLILFAGVALVSCAKEGLFRKESMEALLPCLSAVALIFAAVGTAQRLLGKVAVSTEGNRNYAGALSAMYLPLMVAFTRRGPAWSRALAAAAGAGQIAMLLLSESRGGFLAALAGLLIAGAAMGIRRVPRGRSVAAGAILALAGLGAGMQGARQLSPERMETANFRLEAWKSGLRMAARHPILGWGAGNFAAEYPPFRSEAEFRLSHKYVDEGFKEVEDPHSSWVAAVVETGVPGLLALLLVAYVAARLWRYHVRTAGDSDTVAALAGLGGAAAAYLIAGLFNTLTLHVSPTLLFWCCLALIEGLGDVRPWSQGSRARELRVALPAAAAIVAAFGAFWTLRLGLAEASFVEGMTSSDPSIRETRLREAVDESPQDWRAHYELARTLMAVRRFPSAAAEGKEALRLRPHHVEALNLTAVSLSLGVGNDAEALSLLKHALEVAPYYFKSWYNLGVFQGRRDQVAEARASFSESIRHNPSHALSYYYRGATFLAGGEAAGAIEDFRKARSLGFDVAGALRSEQPSVEKDVRFAEFFR